jgi:bifunctional DNase/RNase
MHFGICVPVKKGVYYKTLRERLHELANEVLERLRQQADANPTDSQKRARYTATLEFVRAQRKRDGITTPDGY